MDSRSTILAALLSALVPAVLCAQPLDPVGDTAWDRAPAPLPTSVRGVGLSPHGPSGGWLGGGPDYRVEFRAEGVQFTPALGTQAPSEERFALAFQSLERGGATLAAGVPAAPLADGQRVSYPRAGGVFERWDLSERGVEFSFLVPNRPPGSGDLVARMSVTTTLPEPVRQPGGGLCFLNDRGQGVEVGAVLGIDQLGRRVEGELRWSSGALELVLPHGFVETAAYPLCIDPLVGTVSGIATGTTFDQTRPDAAFDASTDSYLVVWEQSFSASSSDIRGQRVTSAGVPVGGTIFFGSSGRGKRPQVANLNTPGQWVVVWQEAETLLFGTRWSIELATVRATSGAIVHTAEVASSTAGALEDPDVGGTGPKELGQNSDALVVWRDQGAGRIRCQRYFVTPLDTLGTQAGVTVALDTALGPQVHARPRISRTCGPLGRYLVIYERTSGLAEPNLVGRVVRRDGALESSTITIANSNDAEVDGDVDGLDTKYVVAWTRINSDGGTVEARTVDYTPASQAALLQPVRTVSQVAALNIISAAAPAVGFGLGKTFVGWRVDTFVNSAFLLRGLNTNTCDSCEVFEATLAAAEGVDSERLAIASAHTGGATYDDRGLVVWSARISGSGDVFAQPLQNTFGGGSIANLGGGCGLGGVASFSASPAIGTNWFQFRLEQLPLDAPAAIFNISVPGAAPLLCGPCVANPLQTTSVHLTQSSDGVSNAAATAATIPCSTSLVGISFEVQWTSVTPTSSPCGLFPGFSLSDRHLLTIGQ